MVAPALMSSLRASAVGDWEVCSNHFFSKELLYDLTWQEVDLQQKRLFCAPSGGPIAMMRDDSQLLVIKGPNMRPVVRIFNGSGLEVGNFVWSGGHVATMGWSDDLELLVVEQTGKVYFYSVSGTPINRTLSLGPDFESFGVSHCVVWGSGLAAMSGNQQLWSVANLKEPRVVHMAAPPQGSLAGGGPSCMVVLEPKYSLSSGVEVLLACGQTVYQVDDQAVQDHNLKVGSAIALMALSPDHQFLAVYTEQGKLFVMSSDFSRSLSELDLRNAVPPRQLAWCGVDGVVMYWDGIVLVVGPYGDSVKYRMEEPAVLVSECDGVRVITNSTHELIRQVPESLTETYRPGSTSPAAQLWDARELFDQQSARADKVLREMKSHLLEGVRTCIEAAGMELSVHRQRALLKSAVFGGAFCGSEAHGLMVYETCQKLRLVNALKAPEVGLPLTVPQLEVLTLPGVVARLVQMRHYLLAYRIARMLGAGEEHVLLHWACAKISSATNMTDAALKELLTAKLRSCPTIRFAPLAAHAQSVGRRALALKLLDEETSPSQQVPLLLSLASPGVGPGSTPAAAGEDEDILARSLKKAIESGDTDLVYLVLFHIYKHCPRDFWTLISARKLARNLFVKYCKAKAPDLLETLYTTSGLTSELAALRMRQALVEFNKQSVAAGGAAGVGGAQVVPQHEEKAVQRLVHQLNDAAAKYNQSRDHQFQGKATSDLALLRKEQLKLERDTGQNMFVGLSLMETLRQCVKLRNGKAAAHFRKLFNISEPRWYWLKIRTLSESRDWEGLEEFASEKRSPVGWEPFLTLASKHGAPREYLTRIIARMPDSRAKAEEYSKLDCQREAAEVAAKLSDSDLFAKIQSAVSSTSPAGLAIAQIKERFQSGFK